MFHSEKSDAGKEISSQTIVSDCTSGRFIHQPMLTLEHNHLFPVATETEKQAMFQEQNINHPKSGGWCTMIYKINCYSTSLHFSFNFIVKFTLLTRYLDLTIGPRAKYLPN